MKDLYKIVGAEHYQHENQQFIDDENYYSLFQDELKLFKLLVQNLFKKGQSATFIHFGDGDYRFLKAQPIGSAQPGRRALSVPYNKLDLRPFREGFIKNDHICVEYLESGGRESLRELYPDILATIPTEFLYGLTANKWFFSMFKGHIGLIGAAEKLQLIKQLIQREEYQEYIGLEKFNDYINIPQKFACDDISKTIQMVKEQLEKADPETRIYLCGVGHVKSALFHHLPSFKKAIYIDIGAGIDGLAGLLDPFRPYAYGWVNYRLKNYDYSKIDLLNYDISSDKNMQVLT